MFFVRYFCHIGLCGGLYTIYTKQKTIYNLKLFHWDDEKKIDKKNQ